MPAARQKLRANRRKSKRPLKTLERVLSKAGLASRMEAREWIAAGRVEVNGKKITDPDYWVDLERDRVRLDRRPVEAPRRVYLVLNKPRGYLTTARDPHGRPTIYDLLKDAPCRVIPVGRLDLDTSGLLLLTNDTQFAERLTNPEHNIPKTYLVKAASYLDDSALEMLRRGLLLKDGPTKPAQVKRLREAGGKTVFEITITEGRNRQVRRMVEAVGSKVLKLVRVAVGPLSLEGLPVGQWRRLASAEVKMLAGMKQPNRTAL